MSAKKVEVIDAVIGQAKHADNGGSGNGGSGNGGNAGKKSGNNNTGKRRNKKSAKPVAQITEKKAEAPSTEINEKKPVKNNSGRRKSSHSKQPAEQRKGGDLPLRIAFLGGLNEVGKNLTLYEYDGDMIIVDCGLAFPDQDMPGVDLVIPDFTYIEQNKDRIRGIIITHGHEDHIGALAYLLKAINAPIYGTALTIGLIQARLREHGLANVADLNVIDAGDKIVLGNFEIESIHVNHSIPGALSYAITCGVGTVVQTGDFKIDSTPIDGDMINLARFAEIGEKGVLCMLSDSTNAERPGFTESERKVGESFETLFHKADNRRLIVATFASNIHRVQQILDIAQRLGRKVAFSGRSLENVVAISAELGCLHIPEGLIISIDMVKRYPADKLVIITTGSQGEPLSALARMAFSEHKKVEICPNDCVIISATPIPGNEKTVGKVVNELMKLGAEVIYEKMYEVHVSGHACQEEQKILMGMVKPKFFIPVHGEQKHLRKHAALAKSMGIPESNILIADIGNVVELTQDGIKFGQNVTAGRVLVDGYGVGDVGNVVLRDRKRLAMDGIVVVAASVDSATGYLVSGPDVITRGFIYEKESDGIIDEAKRVSLSVLEEVLDNDYRDISAAKSRIRESISRLMYERTKRSPIILPLILEV